jgi:hypothetical protein
MSQRTAIINNKTPCLKLPSAILSTDLGNRQQATGNRQQATGNRQQATGNRQQANYTHLKKPCQQSYSKYKSPQFYYAVCDSKLPSYSAKPNSLSLFGKTTDFRVCGNTVFFI